MSFKLSLYEVFAYTIPGGFYLITTLYVLSSYRIITIDWNIVKDYSLWLIILSITFSYATGLLLDPIASWIYKNLFKKPSLHEIILNPR